MRRLFWTLFGLWALGIGLCSIAMTNHWGHPCLRPVIIERYYNAFYDSILTDYRTGMTFETRFAGGLRLSPDGAYYYQMPELPALNNEISIISTADNTIRRLYSTTNEVAIIWAADSQSVYMLEVTSQNTQGRKAERFFRMAIPSGEILQEYALPSQLFAAYSPNRHYLYYIEADPDSSDGRMVSIDSITGEKTNFIYAPPRPVDSWSRDNQWMVLETEGQLFVVNAETAQPHPQIAVLAGFESYWTNHSIWYQQASDSVGTNYYRASLLDGSIRLEYEALATLDTISGNDRWRYIGINENRSINYYLHDSQSDTRIPFEIRTPIFTDDGMCLLGFQQNLNSAETQLLFYDLHTLERIHTEHIEWNGSLSLYWYEGE